MLLGTCENNIESSNKNKQNGYFGSPVGDKAISNTYQNRSKIDEMAQGLLSQISMIIILEKN